MMTHFLALALIIALALLCGAATLYLLWFFLVVYEQVSQSRDLTLAFLALIAALSLHPDTAFISWWVIVLWLTKAAFVHGRAAFKRVGSTSTRLQVAQEALALFFLFALACTALHLSLGFAVLATLVIWSAVNSIAKRREWPLLMRTAGRTPTTPTQT